MSDLTQEERQSLSIAVSQVFTPAAPVDEKELFAGRHQEIRRVIDAIKQRGQHAIIFGERGVGKTSLANVLSDFLKVAKTTYPIIAPRVNCDATDKYPTIWRKVFSEITVTRETLPIGFSGQPTTRTRDIGSTHPRTITPDDVRRLLTIVSRDAVLIVIIDEFDRVGNGGTRRLFADTIKTLSDHSVAASVVLVGVADSVNELIEEHQSIERALAQVRMPRESIPLSVAFR